MRQRVLGSLSVIASGLTLFTTVYLALVTMAAWVASRRPRTPATNEPNVRFVVLIPAHDEERLVGDAVRSLLGTDYRTDCKRVVVIADHCTDRTAAVAEAAGAEVLLHDDPEPRGKGAALHWALGLLDARREEYDAVVFVDADSIVNPEFLTELSHPLTSGSVAVQACYLVRDADTSTSTGIREGALALRHFVRPLGRTTLGGSSGLYGNGMAFSADLSRRHSWSNHLTEDLELQLQIVLGGHRVDFAPDAVVRAEMPVTFDGSRTQNERWERGRIELVRSHAPELASAAARARGRQRVVLIDTLADLIVPPMSVLGVALIGSSLLARIAHVADQTNLSATGRRMSSAALVAAAFHLVVGLRLAHVPAHVYRSLLGAPRAMLWKSMLWVRMLAPTRGPDWVRTTRNSPATTRSDR